MTKILVDKAVLEQALEMLNRINAADDDRDFLTEDEAVCTIMAIDELDAALRAALEQPQGEQEPVAWMWSSNDGTPSSVTFGGPNSNTPKDWIVQPLYTRPQPPRQPLTDDEINTIWRNSTHRTTVEVVRAIEAAHGIGGEV